MTDKDKKPHPPTEPEPEQPADVPDQPPKH